MQTLNDTQTIHMDVLFKRHIETLLDIENKK